MREIKFRIWDKKYNMFDNGSPDLFISTDGEVYEKDERIYGMETIVEYDKMDHYEVNQWTGLKDKNGTDIYEGDIVENRVGRRNEICWIEEELAWCARRNRKGKDSTLLLADLDAVAEIEVIGNIFEHRYLLEESK